MALTAKQITALNNLPKYLPILSPQYAGKDDLKLGDMLSELEAAAPDGLITALADAAAAIETAALGALGTTTITAISAPASAAAAGDPPTKAEFDVLVTETADLRARQAENKTAIDNMTTQFGTVRTLINELRTNFNALQAAIDAAAP